jgi:hypothetical protein
MIKVAVSAITIGIVGLSSWLAYTIGFPLIIALLAAAAIVRVSVSLMPQIATKIVRPEPGYLPEGRTIIRLNQALIAISAAALFAFIIALWNRLLPAIGVRDDTLRSFIIAIVVVLPVVFSRTLQIQYADAARPASRHNRTFSRGSTTAVVVIHGIGAKKAGGPLQSVAGPLEQFLYRQAPGTVSVTRRDSTDNLPEYTEFLYESTIGRGQQRSTQRVVMLEVLWADIGRRTSGVRSLIWILKSLPLLGLLVIAPDNRDLNDVSLSRLAYRLTFPVLIVLSLLQPAIRLWVLVLIIAVISTVIFRRTNLIGDVQMAAVNEAAVGEIVENINATIDQALSVAKRVIVVAHSQGGYLSHRALQVRSLSGGSHEKIELVGVGSGLKPIWLLKRFGDWQSVGVATILLLGVSATFISLIPIVLGLLQYATPWIRDWAQPAVRSLIVAPSFSKVHPVPFDWHVMLLWSWKYPLSPVPDLWQVAILASGLLLLFFARWRVLPRFRALRDTDLMRPEALSQWTEITSTIDSVGRLAFPRLLGAEIIETSGVGNPFIDHISYFRVSSPTTWLLASQVFRGVVRQQLPTLRQWAHYLVFRIWRARDFATTLGVLVITIYALDRLSPGVRGIRALAAQLHHPGWAFAALLGIAAIGPIFGAIDRYRMSRAMAVYPIESPPTLTVHSPRARIALLVAWGFVATVVGLSAHFLVQYPAMSITELRLLPIAPVVASGLLFVVAAALSAGYRPSIWTWAVVLVTFFYWMTYLPGRGGAYLVYLTVLVIGAALCTVIVYRRYSYTLLLPSSSWPGDYSYMMRKKN